MEHAAQQVPRDVLGPRDLLVYMVLREEMVALQGLLVVRVLLILANREPQELPGLDPIQVTKGLQVYRGIWVTRVDILECREPQGAKDQGQQEILDYKEIPA